MQRITITHPDDWHLHLRDGNRMKSVVRFSAARFARAIIMPNLRRPVTTTDLALAYRQRIRDALPADTDFQPLMTLYLTDNTAPAEISKAKQTGYVHGVKYYPAGATTHSDDGVTALEKTYAILETMSEVGMPLLIHGEVTDPEVDIFDRERVFVDKILAPLVHRFPALKVVLEHITTSEAVAFIKDAGPHVAATITPQHLLYNRNALFAGGLQPHMYCLPVLKAETDREAVAAAAASGNPKFFLGTDSAPHSKSDKESACGCAGIFSAHAGIELYAQAFEQLGCLDRLEGFASFFGADFYGLRRNNGHLKLSKTPWTPLSDYPFAHERLVPLMAGQQLDWRITNEH